MLKTGLLFISLFCLLHVSAFGRTEFITTVDDVRLSGSQVCFWQAGDGTDYFDQFLAHPSDVECLPGDAIVDMPIGKWNFFAFNGDGFVSAHPDMGTIFQVSDHYNAVGITLHPAGTLDFTSALASLHASAELVVYFANNGIKHSSPTIRRLMPGSAEMLVPAGVPVVPLVMEGTKLVGVGEPIVVRSGERRAVDRVDHGPVFVVPLRLELSDELWRRGEIGAMQITAETSDGRLLQPLVPIRESTDIERSLLMFRADSAKRLTARIGGPMWKPAELVLDLSKDRATMASDWLVGLPASHVSLSWDVDPGAAVVLDEGSECPVREPAAVRLSRCEPVSAGEGEQCRVVKELAGIAPSGELELEALEPGSYRADFRFPPLEDSRVEFEASPLEHERLKHRVSADLVSGIVTRGGVPVLSAMIRAGGLETPIRAADGAYALPVDEELRVIPVGIVACDDSFSYVAMPTAAIPAGGIFDIEVPDNKLVVTVLDAENGDPMRDVTIGYSAVDPSDPDNAYYTGEGRSGEDGTVTIGPLASNYPLVVCATPAGYRHECTQPLNVESSGITRERLHLHRRGHEGRIATGGRVMGGWVFWVGPRGFIREKASQIRPDGVFWYDYDPKPGDYIVVVSQSHPLVVQRPSNLEDVVISVPSSGNTSINVSLSDGYARARGIVTIAVGGLHVPLEAFEQHGRWRNLVEVEKGKPYVIRDLVAGAPVTVLLGPVFGERPLDLPAGADIFVLPQYRGFTDRRTVGSDGRVVF